MDSLTQITLGAAIGEITLGKKIGNRALLWGAIAGTIPDLDVLTGPFVSELQELVYHRGLSHSLAFSVLGAYGIAWIVHQLYRLPYHHYIASILWFLAPIGVAFFLTRFDVGINPIFGIAVFGGTAYLLYRRYFKNPIAKPDATYQDWVKLFFWGLLTHPILDCFTTYGTQLFLPFSSYRVAFNTISVADPLYTVPFLLLVIAVSFLSRRNRLRRRLAWAGLVISSCYMLLCVFHKYQVNNTLINSLESQEIKYERVMTSPTILNNILWYALAETEDGYYSGLYSLWDSEKSITLNFTPRNHQLLELTEPNADDTISKLKWFSNNYYCVTELPGGGLQFNDMRFGKFDESTESNSYIFNFPIKLSASGSYQLTQVNGGPPPRDREKALKNLWDRLMGE